MTQLDVDSLASFVEACDELEKEPFFGKDERMSFQNDARGFTFILGDRFHFRSALISFRRLWMKSEPSYWRKVVEIVNRPEMPKSISSFASYHVAQIERMIAADLHMLQVQIRADRVIDLWLNTVFAHGGIQGPNKRSEFEAFSDQYGHALFEFTFRNLVRSVGGEFCNLSNLAVKEALIEIKDKLGMQPSFRIGAAFGIKRRERTKDGHWIIRQGSSEHFTEETFEQRFARILSRRQHKDLKFVTEQLNRSTNELVKACIKSQSFEHFMEICEGRLEVSSVDLGNGHPLSDYRAACTVEAPGIGDARVNISDEPAVLTNQIGVLVLDHLLGKLRNEVVNE